MPSWKEKKVRPQPNDTLIVKDYLLNFKMMMSMKNERSKRCLGVVVKAMNNLTREYLEQRLRSSDFNKLLGEKMTGLILITNEVEKGKNGWFAGISSLR